MADATEQAVLDAKAALAAAEQAAQNAKGTGVANVVAATKAVAAAKKELAAAEAGVVTAGKTRKEVLADVRTSEVTAKAEQRANIEVPSPTGEGTIKAFDITTRPAAPQESDDFITYYSWVGGASTGRWELYRVANTPVNMATYGSRAVGGKTQAEFGTASRGANALKFQPQPIKNDLGQVIGWTTPTGATAPGSGGSSTTSTTTSAPSVNGLPAGFTAGAFPSELEQLFGSSSDVLGYRIVTNSDGSQSLQVATGPNSWSQFGASFKKDSSGKYVQVTSTGGTGFGGTGSTTQIPAGMDPAMAAMFKSLQDQNNALLAMINKQTAGTQQAALDAAALAAAEKKERSENALLALTDRFTKFGLSSLVPKIRELAIGGATESTITLQLQETPEYQQRFSANTERIKKGLSVLDPGSYLGLEDRYRQILRAYGLKSFDNDSYVQQFLANDVSPEELSGRVVTAVQRVQNADPAIMSTLRDYYGIGTTDLVAYVLDPNQQLQKIERQISAAEIGVAGRRQGLEPGVAVAEQLAAQGISQAQAQKGYATIADILPESTKLSQIYTGVLDQYGQAEAEQEVFNTLASAQRKRRALTEREVASFGGSSGLGRTSLGSTTGGQI